MPRQFFFTKHAPIGEPPYNQSLTLIPIAIIPIALGALDTRSNTFIFEDGYENDGIELLRRLQVSLLTSFDGIDNIYRLLDYHLSGTEYIEVSEGVVTPDIPLIPVTDYTETSIKGRLEAILLAMGDSEEDTEFKLQLFAKLAEILLSLA